LGADKKVKNAQKTQSQKTKQRAWQGEIPLTSLYTAGTGGQIFFHALKTQGKLIGTRCSACEQVYVPARSFCERCFAELTEQIEVRRTGRLISFTICHVDRDGTRLERPESLALVQLDGATTTMLHRLLSVSGPTEVKIGCKVEAVIKPKAKRVGSILDIEGFRVIS
jgi:uncharacterized OB-fold protein